MRNTNLYNAAVSLIKATPIVRLVDKDFADYLLNKAEEYKNSIKIDTELESEVLEIKKEIEKGL
jgi:hypothetical protein